MAPWLLLTFVFSLIESSIGLPTFGLIDPTMLLNFLPVSVTIFWVHVNEGNDPELQPEPFVLTQISILAGALLEMVTQVM